MREKEKAKSSTPTSGAEFAPSPSPTFAFGIPEAIAVALVTLAGYVACYFYNVGYCRTFALPSSVVSVSVEGIIASSVTIFATLLVLVLFTRNMGAAGLQTSPAKTLWIITLLCVGVAILYAAASTFTDFSHGLLWASVVLLLIYGIPSVVIFILGILSRMALR